MLPLRKGVRRPDGTVASSHQRRQPRWFSMGVCVRGLLLGKARSRQEARSETTGAERDSYEVGELC